MFVAGVLLVRRLSVDEYGVFSYARAFPQFFIVLADLGLEQLVVREVAVRRERAGEILAVTLPLKLLLTVAAFGVAIGVLALMGRDSVEFRVTAFMAMYIFARSVMTFLMAFLKGLEDMSWIAWSTVAEAVATLVLIYFLVAYNGTAGSAIRQFFLAFAAGFAVMLPGLLRGAGFPRVSINPGQWLKLLSRSWAIGIGGLAVFVLSFFDVLVVEHFWGSRQVAYYSAAMTLVGVVSYIQNAVSAAAYPIISKFYVSDRDALMKTYEKLFRISSITGLPICAGGYCLAAALMGGLFRQEYTASARAFEILCAANVFTVYASFYGSFATGINRQKFFGVAYIIIAAVNAGVNLLVIPRYGITGAAVTQLVSSAAIIIATYFGVMRPYHKINIGFTIRMLLSLALMAAAALLTPGLNVFLRVAAAGAVYCVAVIVLGAIDKDDWQLARKALGIS